MTFLIIMLVIATICSYIWLYYNRQKLNSSWWFLLIIAVFHTIIGVLCVKLFALIEVGFDMSKVGNMSLYGGIFFMPITYFIFAKIKKISFLKVLDIFTISLVITYFFARVNCLHAGCCIGKNIVNTEFRFPTRELELIYYVVFLIIFIPRVFKKDYSGKAFAIYLLSYGLFRFLSEFLRESTSTGAFHIAHLWSAITLLMSLILLVLIKRKEKKYD